MRIRIQRHRFSPWIALNISGLPRGARATLGPRRTRGSHARLTITTPTNVRPGTYRLRLRGRSGRRVQTLSPVLVIAPAAVLGRPFFTITASTAAPLLPGVPQPIDLQIANPARLRLRVNALTVTVGRINAPHASPALPCTARDFSVTPYRGRFPLVLSPRTSVSLRGLRIPAAQWPQVSIVNRTTDQDGCQGAALTFALRGLGTLG